MISPRGRSGPKFFGAQFRRSASLPISNSSARRARTLRKAAFSESRQAPGDAAEQEVLVVGSRVLPKHFPVLLAQGARAQAAQAFNLSEIGRASCRERV